MHFFATNYDWDNEYPPEIHAVSWGVEWQNNGEGDWILDNVDLTQEQAERIADWCNNNLAPDLSDPDWVERLDAYTKEVTECTQNS